MDDYDYWYDGKRAYEDSMPRDLNPYEIGSEEYDKWDAGWEDGLVNAKLNKKYWNEGVQAYKSNETVNPYDEGTEEHYYWDEGWKYTLAMAEFVRSCNLDEKES